MDLKKMECPNCGANLKFNSKTHHYECEYCKSSFKDTKADEKGNPRVELNPEDLEMLKPQAKGFLNKNDSHAAITLFVIIGFIALVVVGGVISIFVTTLKMTNEMMDDMDDRFDDDFENRFPDFWD